jgi:arylsulfatase A-like enzyme
LTVRPNILIFLIDDMGWRDLSCYGSTFYDTPRIDALARDGVRFTDGYAACPVCSPARACLLTGRYPARIGVTDWIGSNTSGALIEPPYVRQLPLEEYNLARALKDAGYATWHIGKWHLGGEAFYPERQGFDVNIGGSGAGAPHRDGYFSPWNLPNLGNGPDGEYLTDRLTDEALSLIGAHDGAKPFFLNLWHYAVHTPIQAPVQDIERYRAKARALHLNAADPFIPGEPFPCDHKRNANVVRRVIQSDPVYAGMIANLDWNVGRVIDKLEEKGILDDTIILFLSDNGGLSTSEGSPTCNLPLAEGKGWAYEGGLRIPFIVRYPKAFGRGLVSGETVSQADIFPTLLRHAGGRVPNGGSDGNAGTGDAVVLDGIDITEALQGGALPERPLFWHYPHYGNQGGVPSGMVRLGEYKLIDDYERERVALYCLGTDISERRDVAAERPDVRDKLLGLLDEWRRGAGALMPARRGDH